MFKIWPNRLRRLVKEPKRFSCNFLTASTIKDATNAKKDRKVYEIDVVEVDSSHTTLTLRQTQKI